MGNYLAISRLCVRACLLALALSVAACDQKTTPEGEMLSNVMRPGGGAIAMVTRTNGGATVSFAYHVYVQDMHGNPSLAEVLRMDKSNPPHIQWKNRNELLIDVPCGQIYRYSNFTVVRTSQADHFEKIFVALKNNGLCKGG